MEAFVKNPELSHKLLLELSDPRVRKAIKESPGFNNTLFQLIDTNASSKIIGMFALNFPELTNLTRKGKYPDDLVEEPLKSTLKKLKGKYHSSVINQRMESMESLQENQRKYSDPYFHLKFKKDLEHQRLDRELATEIRRNTNKNASTSSFGSNFRLKNDLKFLLNLA